ncbi:RES domain-containing protein [Stenotrophomonas maltophilia]|uniref:RES domain-containing protein n=1 Tax=Stenotrophomonas maltophilia TaxID=40324 RepID=UPI0007395B1C|nr:RES domain-containing protein [Stenotrophomonas maltophilia]CRD59204.1 RES domain protein [Stenotrophomonas maltophilia]
MGFVKNEWMEIQERGWSAPDTFVCADCVDDPYLKNLINDNATSMVCDYCARAEVEDIAAEAQVVMEAIYDAVFTYYCEPAVGGVPYDGGFVVEPIDLPEILYNLGFDGHPDFFQAVVDAESNGNSFVPAADGHWAGSHPHEVLSLGWKMFAYTVKHETRFHFSATPATESRSPYDISTSEILPIIAARLRPLIRTLPAGLEVYRSRVRHRGQTWLPDARQMGAPPKEITSAGRMNPAGIPYLYTSFERATARREIGIVGRTSRTVFTAKFSLNRSLEVIDLTELPAMPSIFDVHSKEAREQALFVRAFVAAISAPVTKNGGEHIDYVPSQVVCEYLAQVFEPKPGSRLGGLIYPSAVHPGGKNLVVFPDDRHSESFNDVNFAVAGK